MTAHAPLYDLRVLDLSHQAEAAACVRLLASLGARIGTQTQVGEVVANDYDLVVTDADSTTVDWHRVLVGKRCLVSITSFGSESGEDRPPPGGSILDGIEPRIVAELAGAHAAVAALAALRWARRADRAVCVEVAAVDVAAACLGDRLAEAICPRAQRDHSVTRERASVGLAVLRCADGYVGIAIPTASYREDLARLTGVPTVRNPAVSLDQVLGPWLLARTRSEVVDACQLWRVPAVPALRPGELLEDAQLLERRVWRQDGDRRIVARTPFRYTRPDGASTHRTLRSWPLSSLPLPLSDIRVLDLGMMWAGPYCARLLVGLGARVIKIEGPVRSDGTRRAGRGACQGVFADLNRGKLSLGLDLAHDEGRDVLLRLARCSDILVENFSPRVMLNFGLAYPVLAETNPRLLMLSLPAFGASGPWANYVAYGSGLELATGLASIGANGAPLLAAVPYLDYLSGCYGALGLLAALLARDREQIGFHLEVAQREVACQLAQPNDCAFSTQPTFEVSKRAIQTDTNLAARALIARRPADTHGCRHLARPPFRLRGVPPTRERSAPGLGSHSRRILSRGAGLTADRIEQLVAQGVVVCAPNAEPAA